MNRQQAAQYDQALAYAAKLGSEHGANAGEWYAQDAFGGRVTRGADESARAILRGIEDGDPAILDTFPSPDLSGEWADTLTGPQLVDDALSFAGIPADGDMLLDRPGWFSDICGAYETAYSDACAAEIERLARLTIGYTDDIVG